MTTNTPSGILSNLGLGAGMLGTGGLFSPKAGSFAATLATTFQTFRTSTNAALTSGMNAVYSARTSFSAMRFGTNALSAVKNIKLIVPSSGSSSDSGSGTQEPGLGGE